MIGTTSTGAVSGENGGGLGGGGDGGGGEGGGDGGGGDGGGGLGGGLGGGDGGGGEGGGGAAAPAAEASRRQTCRQSWTVASGVLALLGGGCSAAGSWRLGEPAAVQQPFGQPALRDGALGEVGGGSAEVYENLAAEGRASRSGCWRRRWSRPCTRRW